MRAVAVAVQSTATETQTVYECVFVCVFICVDVCVYVCVCVFMIEGCILRLKAGREPPSFMQGTFGVRAAW